MLNQKLTWSTLQLITLFASLCLTEVKVPTQNKKAAKVFCEEEWCEKDFWGTERLIWLVQSRLLRVLFLYFFLNKSPSPLIWKKIVVSTLEKPQRSISLNLYCATWNSHFDFHCLKDKMHMQIFFCHFEKACAEKQTVLSSFFCLQRPTEKFLWRNVESTICNTLQWWCHNKGTCTGRGGVEINDLKVSYICLYMCVSHQH